MIEVTIYEPICRTTDDRVAGKVRVEFVKPRRPFLVWATRREAEEIQYPKGYGVAYYDFCKNQLLFTPIPLNVLVGWSIWVWHWLRVGFASWCHRHSKKEV
jgi:hypothetical protein